VEPPAREDDSAAEGACAGREAAAGYGSEADEHTGRTGLRDLFAPLRRSRLTRNEAWLWLAMLHILLKRLSSG
jgi:hypothetical protein